MIINKSIFYLLLIFFVNFNALSKENVHIVYEIGGEIITNVDIKNELQLSLDSIVEEIKNELIMNMQKS